MTGLCGEEAETIPNTGEDCLIGMSGARGSQRAVGCGGKKRVRCLLNVLGDFSDRIGKMFCENSDWIFFGDHFIVLQRLPQTLLFSLH